MKVLKFGGTSVGSAEKMKGVLALLNPKERQMVVLSAVSGTTNALVDIGAAGDNNRELAIQQIERLEASYTPYVEGLFTTDTFLEEGYDVVKKSFEQIRGLIGDSHALSEAAKKIILAQGEIISTRLFVLYVKACGISCGWLDALDFMKIDAEEEPDQPFIAQALRKTLEENVGNLILVTQGYICRNAAGEIDNLKRGGSDYSASLIGAAIGASEIQIWTDIDGMHNNDPRIVTGTRPVPSLSFEEAAELAYFGAKILHPQSILPAQRSGIPVRLLNTMDPSAVGTYISNQPSAGEIKSIAAKDGITAIKIVSSRMFLAYGFLRKVFEVFEKNKTSIDLITTSEVAISVTIDNTLHLDDIITALEPYGTIEVDSHQTIVCVVGDFGAGKNGVASKVLESIAHIPLRMIAYGGSAHNISLLMETRYKKEALTSLHKGLFA